MQVPTLTTNRLLIRPLAVADLDAVQHLYTTIDSVESAGATRAELQRWLEWTALSYGELARLHQPPYGDRAIILQQSGQLIGVCGFVPCLNEFSRLPSFRGIAPEGLNSTEFGLYWAVAPAHQRRGYATEAGRALIDYALGQLRLDRIVATTEEQNVASIGVMKKLGMRIERNPYPDPPWLQVVGVLSHPSLAAGMKIEA
jgi:RimJ/RimL family protein N-acetyltransferase